VLTTIISTIIVLGILVFVHELGHFLLAKKLGVGVLTFSLGFGPKIFWKKIGETQYQIAAVPLGGFVKMIGENPEEEVKEELRNRSFSNQPVWKRALIIGAGSFFNFFLAIVLFSTINLFGIPYSPPKVGEVNPGLPAEAAGLKKEDLILSIDGQDLKKWEDLSRIIRSSQGKELLLRVKRNGETIEIRVTPKPSSVKNLFGEEVSTFVIGITHSGEVLIEKVNPLVALGNGFIQTYQGIKLTLVGIVKLIQRVIPAKTIDSCQDDRRAYPDRPDGRRAGKKRYFEPGAFHGHPQHQSRSHQPLSHPHSRWRPLSLPYIGGDSEEAHQHQEDGDRTADRAHPHHPPDALCLL